MYLHQIQAVGSHGIITSELQRLHYERLLGEHFFPAAVHRRDWHYDVDLDAPVPKVAFAAPQDDSIGSGSPVRGQAHQFASVAYEPATLLWSFADFFAEYREKSPVPRAILDFGRANNLDAFTYQAWAYSDQELAVADTAPLAAELLRFLGGCAVEILGPGYLPIYVSTSPTSRQLILVDGFEPQLRGLEFADVHRHLKTVLDYMFAAGHPLHVPLQGLARHLGWGFQHTPLDGGNRWQLGTPERSLVVTVRGQNGQLVCKIQVEPGANYRG